MLTGATAWELAGFGGLSRPRANWIRLFAFVGCPPPEDIGRRLQALKVFPSDSRFLGCPAPHTALDFDSTLGFPREGPCFGPRLVIISALLPWTWGVLQPRDASDLARQKLRSSELPAGRPVQARTRSNRDSLVAAFSQWLVEVAGFSLETLLSKRPFDPEELCGWITSYGRDLYGSRPYWHFAETVNAVTALKPAFRRQAQGAWDLAFMWLSVWTPHSNAGCCASFDSYRWIKEAGCFALAFGALLRGGEVCKARRRDLVFPSDALWTQNFILLRIEEPKTRSRAAKHQAAKLEPRDLVSVVKLAFEGLRRQSALWPFSQQTLRKRLYAVLERLGLDKSFGREKALDLGSFRPGGATFLLQTCEDSELVRRRGRWVSPKVMEIYLQEIAASTFLGDLPPHVREKVQAAASAFTDTLEKAKVLSAAGVPARV